MPKSKTGGRLKVSQTLPSLFSQKDRAETEVKYFGLVRDNALSDLTSNDKALAEVLRDIQDPAEANVLGTFSPPDLQIIDGVLRYNLKNEDFQVLKNSSIGFTDSTGVTAPLVNPRQRIHDRITQVENFAGRGTIYQGQGTVMYKYYVPENQPLASANKYSHTNPPPFFTESIDSTVENAPDFIPVTPTQIANTHRIGYLQDGKFIPEVENEYWWSGEYSHDFYTADGAIYGSPTDNALKNPKFPIVKDGNLKYDQLFPRGINTRYNWGLRFDTWMKRDDVVGTMMRWAAQVNGHVRIDYFDKSGYNSVTGAVEGTWRTALNTADSQTYYMQIARETPTTDDLGSRKYFVQGGPSMADGAGTGTLPAQRSLADGGAWDLAKTYSNREANAVGNFNGSDYIPVVIRFWYGQPSTDPAQTNPLTNKPVGPASLFFNLIDTDLATVNLSKWNDYSSQLRLTWSTAQSAWFVDTTSGGSAAGDDNFTNFNELYEIIGYTAIGSSKPAALTGYTIPSTVIIATKTSPIVGVTYSTFSIAGIAPTNGQKIWVIAKNRAFNVLPGTASRIRRSLWQKYLFDPDQRGEYSGIADMLENVGKNYTEPDPIKVPFEQNLTLYKSKYGVLPPLNTYGPDRYDGTLANTITTSNVERDYDYNHSKLLMIGRQKKGTVAEIGTTAPYSGKNLAPGEVRKKGENYTFIEVVENQAGFGGGVLINAYPTNDLGVIDTESLTTYGKALHMLDNTTTFSNPTRQNLSTLQINKLPSDLDFSSTLRVLYEEIDGQGRFSYGSWDGTTFTYDSTGVIAQLTLGSGGARNHLTKSAFIAAFKKGASNYSFYGLIGIQRVSFANVALVVNSGDVTITSSSGIFTPNAAGSPNNNQYIGSEIVFPGDATIRRVTSYNATTGVVTFSPAKAAGSYTGCEVWYNHFQLGGVLPSNIVNSSGAKISRASVIPVPSVGNISDRLIQTKFVFNSGYQYLRADTGTGLSFAETLYVKQSDTPSEALPFTSDTELPAPPADIVTPFGYDNSPGSSDPGLGGLCYPPYEIQNIDLQVLAKTDAALYSTPAGSFDIWWGGRIGNVSDMGQRYLYVTNKLMFDFSAAERTNLLSALATAQKPTFTGSEYTHKLEVELNVGLPTNASTAINANIYNDARFHSNNKPVKDKYYLFIRKESGGNQLSVLSANNPSWT